ncbi:MAG: ester cyclase [Ruminococcus sp.]
MTNVEIVYNFFKDGYENKNYNSVMSYLSEDYIDHSPAGARGNAQAVGILKIVESQFSDLTVQVLDIFADNEMVATRVLYEGIHIGECMGIAATGKKIQFEALENFKVVDGKIVESWGYWPDKEIEAKLR